jgi:uncharacterized membrane protein YphA (DoxX/SURF4 family)
MKKFTSSINGLVSVFWYKVEKSCSNDARSLSVYRIIWALFVSALSMPYLSWVGNAPQGLFNPPLISFAAFFQGFPPKWIFTVADVVLVISVVFIGLGIKARLCALVASAVYLLAAAFIYSFGKIDHEILFWAALVCLSQTNWSTHYAVVRDKPLSKQRSNRAMAVAGVLIGFGMFSAGFEKMIRWIDFDTSTSGFLHWFSTRYYSDGGQFLLAPAVLNLPQEFFEIVDYGAVVFELTSLLCLLAGRKWWALWLFAACLFHLSSTLFLNIPFEGHILVYLIFVPIWKLFARVKIKPVLSKKRELPALFTMIALFCLVHLFQRSAGFGSRILFITGNEVETLWRLWVAACLWPLMAIIIATWYMKIVSSNTRAASEARSASITN